MSTGQRRVVTINSSGFVKVQQEPIPPLKPGQLLIRVHASLISAGTELSGFRGKQRVEEGTFRPFGYQNAGEVIAIGENCRGFEIGQRVACMGGGYAGHADYTCAAQNMVVPLPDSMSYEEGAFAALAATAMQAVRRGEVVLGEEVVVLGLGVVGQITAQLCQIAGARVLAIDPLPLRVEAARRTGITFATTETGAAAVARAASVTEGHGMDCAFICFGGDATAALQDVARMMKQAPDTHRYGRIVIPGGATITHRFGAPLGNLDLRSSARTGPGYHDHAYEHGADYPQVFVRWSTQAHLRLFTRLVSEGKLNVKDLITDRVPVEEADAACYALIDAPDKHLGVIIEYR